MQITLTIVDRIILETLQQQTLTLFELETCTGLPDYVLKPALQSLVLVGFVRINESEYCLNKSEVLNAKNDLNSPEQIELELELELVEIVQTCIQNKLAKKQNSFNLKKVYLDSREEKIYQGLIYNLNSFLSSIKTKNTSTKDKKIIFWGEDTYENITNSIINS